MAFNFVRLPELDFDLKTETIDGKRYYVTPTGNKYPSVTSVLSAFKGDGLKQWIERVGEKEAAKITRIAGNRGTRMHSLCEDYINGKLSSLKLNTLMPFDKMMFGQVKGNLDQYLGDVYCLEQSLYSDRLKLAGRVDCVAVWKNKLSVIDFKTSIKEKREDWIENYFIQCTAYAEMFGDLTGRAIDDIVVLIATEEQIPQVFERKRENYVSQLHKYINSFIAV